MSQLLRLRGTCVALLFVVASAWGTFARPAEAVVGDLLMTVNIPDAAKCGTSSGTAVAVVPGGKLNFPKIQTVLVTSCVQAGQAKLFFLDPSTDPATLVKTINTSITPTNGWESLAARPDRVDLVGCGMVGGVPKVYSIDYSSILPNTTPDGTATLLFTGPTGSTCQGLAWDVTSNPKTIYQSASTSPSVRHLSEAGASVSGDVASGCPGATTGVAVGVVNSATLPFAGSVLFAACPEAVESPPAIRQIKKVDGSPVTSVELPDGSLDLTSITSRPGDIECDPVTFGLSQSWHSGIRNTDVLWVKGTDDANPHKLYAMGLPFAACGPVPPPPTPVADACDLGIDTDGDGLPDCWEDGTRWADGFPGIALDGIYTAGRTATSTNRFVLCVESNGVSGFQAIECADRLQRDIFVEIDYMQHHQPNPLAVSDVVTAFANAPAFSQVAGSPGVGKCDGPGCTSGIRLHVQIDEQFPHVNNTALAPCTGPRGANDADFDAIKNATAFPTGGFGTPAERANVSALNAKRLAFHYGLFVHNQSPTPPAASSSSSGCAELFGNDFMVSLGGWAPPNPAISGHTGGVGSRAEQAGTFMHELGHNLGLRHGGVDNVNCKPQHLSVMNYAYQFPNIVIDRPLTYSSVALGANPTLQCGLPAETPIGLNEACLQEALGIGNLTAVKIAFGPPTGVPAKTTIAPVSVAPNGPVNWNKDVDSMDVNVARDLNQMTSSSGGCPASSGGFLEGSNDWQILQLNLRASTDFADGVSQNFDPPVTDGTKELTVDDALDLSHDLIDIKPNDKNNTINLGSTATFEVAMFSRKSADGTTVDVDATTIDPSDITLRGLPPGPEWSLTVRGGGDCKTQDVNKDGLDDLVCKFRWDPGPVVSPVFQRAVLTVTTPSGYDFLSSDTIRFVQ
jgi:Metallo-peptidase family M12B Reprolysin-like